MAATLFSGEDVSQVGNFFITQYYNNLYKHPEEMYMFYKEESTITWVDGNNVESAAGLLEIHALISVVKFSSIEIKTANFLRSYGDGLMALVSGLVQTGQYERRRKFIQAFFLAPQNSGYYILNDLFHYVDEEYFCNPDVLAQGSYENLPKPLVASEADVIAQGISENLREPEPLVASEAVDDYNYTNDGQVGLDDLLVPAYTHDNGNHSSYKYSEQTQHVASQTNCLIEETISSLSNTTISTVADSSGIAPYVDQSGEEPARHTYASILKAGVSETEQSVPYEPPVPRSSSANFEAQQPDRSYPSDEPTPVVNAAEDYTVDSKSVYVKNVSRYFNEADLEVEFNKFGRVVPDGVAIRSHKETGRYYAFVEYEDSDGAENAIQASPVVIGGWEMYVEERKRGTGAASRGRGRGRGGRVSSRGRGRSDGYHSRANMFDQEHHFNSEWGISKKQSPREERHRSFELPTAHFRN